MTNTKLLIALSEAKGFMNLSTGVTPYYPILRINEDRFSDNRGNFITEKDSSTKHFENDINLWDKCSNDTSLGFEYFGARSSDQLQLVEQNATDFVRNLDVPLLLLDKHKEDGKIIVYSTIRGMDTINDFFEKNTQFSKEDLHIDIV